MLRIFFVLIGYSFFSSSVLAQGWQDMTKEEFQEYRLSISYRPDKLIPLAEQEIPWAMADLAWLYHIGMDEDDYPAYRVRIEQDKCKALKLFDKAARKHNAYAQSFLALSYILGSGVQESCFNSYKWAIAATKNGKSKDDLFEIKSCEKKLSPKEIEEANHFMPENSHPIEIIDFPNTIFFNGLVRPYIGGHSCKW
ncbi:MAG: sel1 repeat family protein [Methylocystaceae bacterium]|nr:sel1 repeat family protein [Methylocystaceae bacterium]